MIRVNVNTRAIWKTQRSTMVNDGAPNCPWLQTTNRNRQRRLIHLWKELHTHSSKDTTNKLMDVTNLVTLDVTLQKWEMTPNHRGLNTNKQVTFTTAGIEHVLSNISATVISGWLLSQPHFMISISKHRFNVGVSSSSLLRRAEFVACYLLDGEHWPMTIYH